MKYVPIDYIKNYLPKPLVQRVADDNQIYSWVMQAWRKLNFPHLRFVKDIVFLEVKNHKTRLPHDFKSMVGVSVNVTNPTQDEIDELCSSVTLPNNNSFAQPCPVTYDLFVGSCLYKNNWQKVTFVGNLKDDYLCRITNDLERHVYSTEPNSDILTFDFLEGIIALKYNANLKDDFGRLLLPEEPDVLWQYFAEFVKEQYWEEQVFYGTQGAERNAVRAQLKKAGYYEGAKSWILFEAMSIEDAIETYYGLTRILKLPSFIHRYFSNIYANAERSILSEASTRLKS